jgi:hypothetical protein
MQDGHFYRQAEQKFDDDNCSLKSVHSLESIEQGFEPWQLNRMRFNEAIFQT